MRFNIINKKNIIIDNSLLINFNILNNLRKILLVLSNQQELLNLKNTQTYFLRKFVKDYDLDYSETISKDDIKFIKERYIPMIAGLNISYMGNLSVNYFKILSYMPSNSDIAFVKVIGPGEIYNGVLEVYDHVSKLLVDYNHNKSENYIDYISWNSQEKYNTINSIHKTELLKPSQKISVSKKKDAVFYTKEHNYLKKHINENESISLSRRLFHIITSLDLLKKNGTFYFGSFIAYEESTLQLLSELSLLFESYEFISSDFDYSSGMIIFKNYKGNHSFHSVFNEYYKLDKTLGEKFIKDFKNIILFNFNVNIDKKFIEFYKKYLIWRKEKFEDIIKKINYIKKNLNNDFFIKKIINDQIEYGLQFCNENELKINRYYKKNLFKLNNINLKKKIFPNFGYFIDYNKLELDYTATYSMSYPKESQVISEIIKTRYPEIKTIADMTSNVGGNTINFCKNFNFVYAVEINKKTSQMLKNNLDIYKFKNYKLLNMDSNLFNEKVDLHFYDPPWTGIFYKMHVNMSLYLSKINIVDIIKPNFCLKVPYNYNYYELLEKYPNLEIIKIKNYVIIFNK